MKRIIVGLFVLLLSLTGIVVGSGVASADVCRPTWTIGVGGFGDPNSTSFGNTVDQRVGYSATVDSASAQSGVNELNRLIRIHRAQCGADHIKIIGHSEGAAVVHIWITNNSNFPNANAILLADPKRAAGPGGPGFASLGFWLGYPLQGVDNYFGGFTVQTICFHGDGICDINAGPVGYLTGAHINSYNFNAGFYSNYATGVFYF